MQFLQVGHAAIDFDIAQVPAIVVQDDLPGTFRGPPPVVVTGMPVQPPYSSQSVVVDQ